ncbi:ATP-dependent DNA ligase [Streptomyces sp. NPDC048251]|uniref:ATP-dependent DNA ligase n=1 Tax=Streptomyces sp. NPDC048251 TaxID=3154501 RepID=UPI00342C9240
MTWHLPQPILAAPTADPALPPGWTAEPKWDGYRAQLARYADGRVLLHSRRGTDMTPSFPEIEAAAAQLPGDTGLDGELVVWEEGRLAFERLQQRLPRRGSTAGAAATRWPAHFVVFDVLRLAGTDTTAWSYRRRRTALDELFTDLRLQAPWTLTASTTDPDTAHGWLDWTAAGMEGLCFKRLTEPYRPTTRTWRKYKVRATHDAIVGAVTGPLSTPSSLLLGRYDSTDRLQYIGRTTTLSPASAHHCRTPDPGSRAPMGRVAVLRRVGQPGNAERHAGATQTGGRGQRADVARDGAGRFRHPVRLLRVRDDLTPDNS